MCRLPPSQTRQPVRVSVLPSDFDPSTRQKAVSTYDRNPAGAGTSVQWLVIGNPIRSKVLYLRMAANGCDCSRIAAD
jgi:hypothetical protein